MELGSKVKKFKVGDIVGVVCLVGSCGECLYCDSNLENYCNDRIFSYSGINKDGTCTQGGFSSAMVVHQKYENIYRKETETNLHFLIVSNNAQVNAGLL